MILSRSSVNDLAWVLAVVCLFSGGCAPEQEAIEPQVRPVVTMRIETSNQLFEKSFSCTAISAETRVLSFRVSGQVRDIPATVGAQVSVGDVLARLDSTDYELEVNRASAGLSQAEAALLQARAEFDRSSALYGAEKVSKSVYDKDLAAWQSAKAQRDAADKSFALATNQVNYCTLRAPIDGVIDSIPVKENQSVSAGTAVVTLAGSSNIQVQTGIPESLINQVTKGKLAVVQFDVFPDVTFGAQVSEIRVTTSESTTYQVTLDVERGAHAIRPGMIGEVKMQFQPVSEAGFVVVPPSCIVGTADGKLYAWVVLPTGDHGDSNLSVKRQLVTIGDLTSEGLIIETGLKPGDVLVTRGVHRLSEGMKVKLLE